MANNRAWFDKALEVMDHTHALFAASVAPPRKVPFVGSFSYRYLEKTLEQAVIQKLARIVSGLRAADLLLSQGYLQEAATIQRAIDEAHEDTLFLVYGKLTGCTTKDHEKYLENFWAESPTSKPIVQRPKIRDYIASTEAQMTGAVAKDIVQPIITIYGMYSGYAHAASVHVMELYDGLPPNWKLRGNTGSQAQKDQFYDIRNQYYRGAVTFANSALLFNSPDMFRKLMAFAGSLMEATRDD